MNPSDSIAAIILAAGMSQRMGRLKPLLPFGDRPMLARVVETFRAVPEIFPIIVVTGYAEKEIRAVLEEYSIITAHNPDYESGGMLSSVQTGVRALPAECVAFFLALGDQPMVSHQTLRDLLSARQNISSSLTLPVFEGKRGHPVLFAAHCATEILALPADATLKNVVLRHAADTCETPVDDPAILADVDTPEDYEHTLRLWEKSFENSAL
jgi:molybdenum cofactor cytidylyltransferase